MSNNNLPKTPVDNFSTNLKKSINSIFFSGDISLLVTIVLFFTVISIGGIFLFEVGLANMRTQFTNNITGAVLSVLFVILIFKFMDSKVTILDKEFEVGLLFYLAIVFGMLLLFSN